MSRGRRPPRLSPGSGRGRERKTSGPDPVVPPGSTAVTEVTHILQGEARAAARPPDRRPRRGGGSDLLHGLDVVARLRRPAEDPVGLLVLVLVLDLREVQAALVRRHLVAVRAAAGLEARDEQVRHRHLEELALLLARLAAGEDP